jgi:type IV pilus assembly protein PilM
VLESLKRILQDPPPGMAFEISEAGIAVARMGSRAELDFRPLKPGVLSISPLKENVIEPDELSLGVRALLGAQAMRKRRDIALILPDFCTRIAVLDFDEFPSDPKEQLSLVRFRLKRSVPFDVESAAVGYWAQHVTGKKCDVVVVMTPLEIVSRYEAPFRAAGMNPGFVTPSVLAALELATDGGVNILAKLSGHVLTVVVRASGIIKLVRCLEVPSPAWEDVAAVLMPTFVFAEDNLGTRVDRLILCGFGPETDNAMRRFQAELEVEAEPLRSPFGMPGENNAGLLGYARSLAKYN